MWLKFDLGQNYDLEKLRIWNGDFFRDDHTAGAYSAKQTDFWYSSAAGDPGDDSGTGWTTAGSKTLTTPTINSGGVSGGDFSFTDEIDLTGINARWFAMEVNTNDGQSYFKLAEVQFHQIPEPSSFALFGLAGVGLMLRRRR